MIAALLLMAAAPMANCDKPEMLAQMELNMCVYQDFQRADAELNVQWRRTATAMREADRQIDRTYDKQPLYHDTLLAAQRAWLTFRDQHCELESFDARGGSMQPMLVSGCKARLTRERTKQLKELVETN